MSICRQDDRNLHMDYGQGGLAAYKYCLNCPSLQPIHSDGDRGGKTVKTHGQTLTLTCDSVSSQDNPSNWQTASSMLSQPSDISGLR